LHSDSELSRNQRWCPGIIATGWLGALGPMKFSITTPKMLSKNVMERLKKGC
jgi:hypothetical protein